MNIETLETFVLLSECKNYTQTANRLFIAQSTVTNRIQELEFELGKSLFIRDRRNLRLTDEGERFLIYARRILDLKTSALDELQNMSHFKHSIRIGSTNTIYDCHLCDRLVSFSNDNPDTKLTVSIAHSNLLLQMLQDNTIDVAFTYVPTTKKNIVCSCFATDELVLVTHPKNETYKKGIHKSEFADIPYLYCDFPFQELGSYIRDLFPAGHAFPLEIDRSANLLPFLCNGKGYSFLPASLVHDYVNNGSLIQIPLLDFAIPPVRCYQLYMENGSYDKNTSNWRIL